MDHERISQIFFDETYEVPPHQTARSLFTRLPHGRPYAHTLIDCIASGYLVAVIESICIQQMQLHIDQVDKVVVGRSIQMEHRGPAPSGTTVRISGWTQQVGRRSATFCVRAYDERELICEAQVTLVAAERGALESKAASKHADARVGAGED